MSPGEKPPGKLADRLPKRARPGSLSSPLSSPLGAPGAPEDEKPGSGVEVTAGAVSPAQLLPEHPEENRRRPRNKKWAHLRYDKPVLVGRRIAIRIGKQEREALGAWATVNKMNLSQAVRTLIRVGIRKDGEGFDAAWRASAQKEGYTSGMRRFKDVISKLVDQTLQGLE